MREIKEYTAEVFRRSEKRIKARRKRRNRMLMACVPLVLCLAAVGGALLVGRTPVRPEDPGSPEAATAPVATLPFPGTAGESGLGSVARIDVVGADISLSYTDATRVLELSDCLRSLAAQGPKGNGAAAEEALNEADWSERNSQENMSSISDSTASGYTVTLTGHDGTQTQYCLTGATLTDLGTGQRIPLTQKQLSQLKALLGIADSGSQGR